MESFCSKCVVLMFFLEIIVAIAAHPMCIHEYAAAGNNYDVTKFGAVGDGIKDDTRAFQSAWKAACNAKSNNVAIILPRAKKFLVSPINFEGPCKSRITFLIQGTILAPPKAAWKGKSVEEWLSIHDVDGLVVDGQGTGLIDGRGETWWQKNSKDDKSRPTALRFSSCNNLLVRGLHHQNSQKNHVSINTCNGVLVSNLNMKAPADSPNTDGIDISGSTKIYIKDSIIATGDDCIAINGGTSNVNIKNLACGPGHGISVGSLGKDGKRDEVQGITVSDCKFTNTDNGVRIKTWQGGSGFAKSISFTNINFIDTKNPIIIDQFYCPHKECATQKSAVKISDVRFVGLHGTFLSSEDGAINLSCSKTVPCDNIILEDINIKPAKPDIPKTTHCMNVQGEARGTVIPKVNCIQSA